MEKKKVHFMGLGGAGISAVASFAKADDFEISGCDIDNSSPFLKSLIANGVPFFSTHDGAHVKNIDYLVVSPAIESLDPNNPEVAAAKEVNIPVLIGEEFLAKFIIGNKKLFTKCGWSPFMGWKVKGKVKKVFIRGEKVFENGQLFVKPGFGKIIKPL